MAQKKAATKSGQKVKDWSESSSVFDPLYEQLAKRLTKGVSKVGEKLFDPKDPTTYMNPMGVPVAPLISIYKNAAQRALGTQQFLDTVNKFASGVSHMGASKPVIRAAQEFAKRYPRVAAHMRLNPDPPVGTSYSANIDYMDPSRTKPMEFRISEEGLRNINARPSSADEYIFHEGTHAAQNLGNKDFEKLYGISRELGQYSQTAYERPAFFRGTIEKARQEMNSDPLKTRNFDDPKVFRKFFKENREYTRKLTPEIKKWKAIVASAKNSPAEQRLLAADILRKELDSAGFVPMTSARIFDETITENLSRGPAFQRDIDWAKAAQTILDTRAKAGWKPALPTIRTPETFNRR